MSDSLVRVSRRGKELHFLRPVPKRARHKAVCLPETTLSSPRAHNSPPKGQANTPAAYTEDLRFPLSNFRHSLTLFSKFFSSFLHSTCSLSVSCQYLALDEIYHPFWAAFPNNPTRRDRLVWQRRRHRTGFSPSTMSFSKELRWSAKPKTVL